MDAKKWRAMKNPYTHPPGWNPGAQCPKGKFMFADLDSAQQECNRLSKKNYLDARRMKREHGIKVKQEKVRPYICAFCGQWHIGRGAKGPDADWNTRRIFVAQQSS